MSEWRVVITIDNGTLVPVPYPDRRSACDAAVVIERAMARGEEGPVRIIDADGGAVVVAPLSGVARVEVVKS